MRKLVLAAACATVALTPACVGVVSNSISQRIVILGVDGMDPDIATDLMREGRLPNLSRLAKRGGVAPLETMPAPDCEAAWASLAVGRYVARPEITHRPARLLWNLVPIARETWATTRTGDPFWTIAGRTGVRTSVLAVPGSFPPEPVPNGELLAGLPLPDVHHTNGTYQFFSSALPASDEGTTANGGILRRLVFERRVARSALLGPLHPVTREQLTVPMSLTWNHEARSVNVQIGTHAVHLREREWSRWLEIDFAVNAMSRVRGFTQLFLMRAGTELQLYASPVQWHPAAPPAPISSPPSFANELYDRLGLFRTTGWNAATAALTDERLDEAAFLDDADRAYQDRAETILNRMDTQQWNVLFGVVELPDRVQHMMWRLIDSGHPRYDFELARRYGSSIEQSYQRADELLGEMLARVDLEAPGTLVMVVSDHGFHSVRSPSKWSGDHTEADPARVAGLLVSSVPFATHTPRLIDIAPTVLKQLGVAIPADVAGKPLF